MANMMKAEDYVDNRLHGLPRAENTSAQHAHHGQQLKREWGWWSLFSFASITLSTWEASIGLVGTAFLNGGPSALLYGCIASAVGTLCIYASLSEIASMQPMIGAQYTWTAKFSPRRIQAFASYVQGWLTTLAWQVWIPTITYFVASDLRAIIIFLCPTYTPQQWHICLIMIGVILSSCFFAILAKRSLPALLCAIAVFHFALFAVAVIILLAVGTRMNDEWVWENTQSRGGWDNPGISFCIGFLSLGTALSGGEGCVHLAEESHNPEVVVPKAIMGSSLLSVTTAFVFCVVALYSIRDVGALLSSPTGSFLMEMFHQATASPTIAATIQALVIIPGFGASLVALIGASRLTWAFARDGGFGSTEFLSQINPKFRVPLRAIIANTTIAMLLSLIVLGSPVAFFAVVSFFALCLYTSYFITIVIFLRYRLKNSRATIPYGPWRLSSFGIPINIIALCFCLFFIVFLPFPLVESVSTMTMNYAGPVLGGVLVAVTGSWFVYGRTHFKGPIVGVVIESQNGHGAFTVYAREPWLEAEKSSASTSS